MECSRQHYNTKIFRGCQCQWQSLALDKRGTCTCTGRVTAQGNKDTMTTMVVVIRGGRANLHKIKSDEDYGRMIVDRWSMGWEQWLQWQILWLYRKSTTSFTTKSAGIRWMWAFNLVLFFRFRLSLVLIFSISNFFFSVITFFFRFSFFFFFFFFITGVVFTEGVPVSAIVASQGCLFVQKT